MNVDLVWQILLVAVCLGMGGILKGATGAGAPILAIPALVLMFDVHFAIAVMVVPNVLTNCWQAWKFRAHLPDKVFMIQLIIGGLIGVVIGTYMLASLSGDTLSLLVAFSVLGYVVLRLAKPDWKISMELAKKLSLPAGIASGFLQGASGLSAPASLTFLNAMRLPRPVFVATISMFFATFTSTQFFALWFNGLLTPRGLIYSAFAVVPILLAMPLGAKLAQTVKPEIFDRMILILLSIIAVRLLFGVFF